ncbi:MAG TPA: carboxypeptidase-like regulatory domain-containing protein, partial [Kofleriaceae bacterium]|nr:carboxypeptidase-like regulatory domain-containing protein [Kofleriaceae bacterium]
MRSLAVLAILVVSSPASAQIAAALGKPLPSSDLPAGTLMVRAINTGVTDPIVNVKVTLVVDGKPREATTDAAGRARFDGITAGAKVKASVTAKGKTATSSEFPVPADMGVRVMLATNFVDNSMKLPPPRDFSGDEAPDDK